MREILYSRQIITTVIIELVRQFRKRSNQELPANLLFATWPFANLP